MKEKWFALWSLFIHTNDFCAQIGREQPLDWVRRYIYLQVLQKKEFGLNYDKVCMRC